MTEDFSAEEERYVEQAREQAAIYTHLTRNDAGNWATRHRFDALVVDARTATLEQVHAALVDFARPALDFSQLPREMMAWSARVGDWHVVFYGSAPSAPSWIEGEHLQERFGELASYFHVEHHEKDRRFDRVVHWNGTELSGEESFAHLHAKTGLALSDLQGAIAKGTAQWLICRSAIVLPGVERNRIAVRRPSEPLPKPNLPSDPQARFEAVIGEAEKQWVDVFEGEIFAHARALADGGKVMIDPLVAALTSKGPKPRTSRMALAALGMLGDPWTANAIVLWLDKTSVPVRRAAIAALATMAESARAALEEGAKSRKSKVKSACTGLLRLLDDEKWASLRALRRARDEVPGAIRERLASDDLYAINVQDLDWQQREAERERRIREGGAATAAWYLRYRIERRDLATVFGRRLDVGDVVALAKDDPLGAFIVPLVVLERPLPGQKALLESTSHTFGKNARARVTEIEKTVTGV